MSGGEVAGVVVALGGWLAAMVGVIVYGPREDVYGPQEGGESSDTRQ